MRFYLSARLRLGLALAVSSLVSVGFFLINAHTTHSREFAYMNWNLFLAWLPLALALWLVRVLRRKLWSSWEALLITAVWISFLPNSFYMISDFVHVQDIPSARLLYAVIMFASFIFNGVILGYLSLLLVHQELLQRVSRRTAGSLIGVVLAICSFAIYLGHDLRWNTWDVLRNPGGILVDISNHITNPTDRLDIYTTTLGFFVLLSSLYIVMWYVARNMRQLKT